MNNHPPTSKGRTTRVVALVLVAALAIAGFAVARLGSSAAAPSAVATPDTTIPIPAATVTRDTTSRTPAPAVTRDTTSPTPAPAVTPDTTSPTPAPAVTPDTNGSQPRVRLAVLGDVGDGDLNEWSTAELVTQAASAQPFDGLVLLGDNAYPHGDPARLDATVFEPFVTILEGTTALLPVLGNHDVERGHAAGQVEALGMPGRWYATEMGPMLLIALDSNLVRDPEQLRWLEATLAGNDTPWVIVAMHHPAYSAGYHGSTAEVQEAWVPIFENYGVDLVLAAHDHDYQRMRPINGVTYIVSGGGGAEIRPTGRSDHTAHSASVRHFLDVAIWDDRLEITAIGEDGAFDQIAITSES